MKHNSNNNQQNPLFTQLWYAATVGDTATIRKLAKLNIDLDAPNPQGLSAFTLATQNRHLETAKTIHTLWLASRTGYIPGMLVHGVSRLSSRF